MTTVDEVYAFDFGGISAGAVEDLNAAFEGGDWMMGWGRIGVKNGG